MSDNVQFQVQRDQLAQTRFDRQPLRPPAEGEIVARVQNYALTANNITYGVTGDVIGYWRFFPAPGPWGVIPVWGFAEVCDSAHPEVGVGERLYGFLPMASHVRLSPVAVRETRLVDGAAHRADLPAVYNHYSRWADGNNDDPELDDQRMLLRPLYVTSYCLADYLQDNEQFGATQVLVPSASSKTAVGFAQALRATQSPLRAVGLTSDSRVAAVDSLGLYDQVMGYADAEKVDAHEPTVIVDMSGNGSLLSRLHGHLGEQMRMTAKVGLTHYDAAETSDGYIKDRSRFFFAPSHIAKRAQDWGPGEFEKRAHQFWRDAARSSQQWLKVEHHDGPDAVESAYKRLLRGEVAADTGIIASL